MKDFYINKFGSFKIGNFEFVFTDTHISLTIITILLLGFSYYVNRRLNRFNEVPKGFQNFIEWIVETFDNFALDTMGEKGKKFASYFGVLFIFILIANISGIFGIRPPTADYPVPLGLALITFAMVQYYGVKTKGIGGYLKGLTEPVPLLTPLNIIGEISNPLSLSFRLFGNILGGTILMSLFYSLPPFVRVGIPAPLHFYFDLFAGALQAFVFVMLSMVFLSDAIE